MDNVKEPLISVIIPTYKSVNTVGRLLDSLLEQSYKNLEILLIDDCSPDETVELLKSYEQKDTRVRVYVLPQNSGTPSAARNYGLEIAQGEYVTFCDHDDYFLNKNAIRRLWQDLHNNHADTSYYGFSHIKGKTQSLIDGSEYIFEEKFFTSFLESIKTMRYGILAWLRLYKLSLIKEHNIRFPAGLVFEDCWFTCHYMLFAKCGSTYTSKPYYCWVESPSLTNLSKKKEYYSRDIFPFLEFLYTLYERCGYQVLARRSLFVHTFIYFHTYLDLRLDFFRQTKKFFRKHWQHLPALLGRKERLVWWLFSHSSLLSYVYFVLIKDSFLRRCWFIFKESYLGQFLRKLMYFLMVVVLTNSLNLIKSLWRYFLLRTSILKS